MDPRHAERRKAPHHLYIHINPDTRELIYVGCTSIKQRAFNFACRRHFHLLELQSLVQQGWRPEQIAHVIAENVSFQGARDLEWGVIQKRRPRHNVLGNPDYWPNFHAAQAAAKGAAA